MQVNFEPLNKYKTPVQAKVGDTDATSLGLGGAPPVLMKMRGAMKLKGGPPFGGMGFFDSTTIPADVEFDPALNKMTKADVEKAKLDQFTLSKVSDDSIYMWALQPIYSTDDQLVAVEILLRAKNGSDTAPYEDVLELCNPAASPEIKEIYYSWKLAELVDWPLKILRAYPAFQNLRGISVNLRPLDLDVAGVFYPMLKARLDALDAADRELYFKVVAIEVTEDQANPANISECYKAWKALGFSLHYDDTIGDKAHAALGAKGENFHTTSALAKDIEFFDTVKVDINWAGFLLFLSHPAYSFSKEKKAEVLASARDNDEVKKPGGKEMGVVAGFKHSELLKEFADWCKSMIAQNKKIGIELTVRQDDENCSFALNKLKELGLDIFGEHKDRFVFQGGLTGAKAFTPEVLAESIVRPAE